MGSSGREDRGSVGLLIRRQRELADLSLRELARMSRVSNAYLSQVERGLHEPSLRVLSAIAGALSVPLEDLVAQHTGRGSDRRTGHVEEAIRSDARLTAAQQDALVTTYRSYLAAGTSGSPE